LIILLLSERSRNSNLASEFYVLSMLHRLGLEACLTLGNKKSVDIVIAYGQGKAANVEVKAVAGRDDWLNLPDGSLPNYFIVLVSFEGHMNDPACSPRCWIYRYDEILPLIRTAKKGLRYVRRKDILAAQNHKNRWMILSDLLKDGN